MKPTLLEIATSVLLLEIALSVLFGMIVFGFFVWFAIKMLTCGRMT